MKIIRKIAVVAGKSVIGLALLVLMAPMMLVALFFAVPFMLARLIYEECLEPMADGFISLIKSTYAKALEAVFNIKGN